MIHPVDQKIRETLNRILNGEIRPVLEIRRIISLRLDSTIPNDPSFLTIRAIDSDLDSVVPLGWSSESMNVEINAPLDRYFAEIDSDLKGACRELLEAISKAETAN